MDSMGGFGDSSGSGSSFGSSDPGSPFSPGNPSSPLNRESSSGRRGRDEPSSAWDSSDDRGTSRRPTGSTSGGTGCGKGGLLVILLIILGGLVILLCNTTSSYQTNPIPRPADAAPPAVSSPSPQVGMRYAEIVWVGLNVRSEPGIDNPVIDNTSLVKGMTVPVIARDAKTGWLQIRLPNGQVGWISGDPTYVAITD